MRFYEARTDSWSKTKWHIASDLLRAAPVDVGKWHSKPTEGNKLLVTPEIQDAIVVGPAWHSPAKIAEDLHANAEWAEEHFQERIGGQPLNPPPSHERWPHAHAQHQTVAGEKFSHTYPERIWPKWAGEEYEGMKGTSGAWEPSRGVRFENGDLDDLINLLVQDPYTRQAYLPIYFPEDTGLEARHPGERVPCSLGYHFMLRGEELSCRYYLRSCDFVRHWGDDVYMAARLVQHVAAEVASKIPLAVEPGDLIVYVSSMHMMEGDRAKVKKYVGEEQWGL